MTIPYTYLIIDLVIVAVLLIFALFGAKRGLVLTLCGLVAVLVAFAGASFLANLFAPKVSAVLEPHLANAIEGALHDRVDGAAEGDALFNPLSMLRGVGLYEEALDALEQAVESGVDAAVTAAATAAGTALARTVSYIGVFAIAFLLVLILWWVFSYALDLACRLPVLHTFNTGGGFLLGLAKGAILLFVAAWIARHWGTLIPAEVVENTFVLRFFMTVNPITLITGI